MKTQAVTIVSIHPDPADLRALDVKDILVALGPHLSQWKWCVRNLDWLGENAENLCRKVDAAGPAGLWLTSQELLDEARKVYQTVEGEFLAFPHDVNPEALSSQEYSLCEFPASKAELAIVAVDGCFLEVYTKESDLLASLKEFADVHEEDPRLYF